MLQAGVKINRHREWHKQAFSRFCKNWKLKNAAKRDGTPVKPHFSHKKLDKDFASASQRRIMDDKTIQTIQGADFVVIPTLPTARNTLCNRISQLARVPIEEGPEVKSRQIVRR